MVPDAKPGVSVRSELPSLTASPLSVASVETGGGVPDTAAPLTRRAKAELRLFQLVAAR